jgi:hypothetical protein
VLFLKPDGIFVLLAFIGQLPSDVTDLKDMSSREAGGWDGSRGTHYLVRLADI